MSRPSFAVSRGRDPGVAPPTTSRHGSSDELTEAFERRFLRLAGFVALVDVSPNLGQHRTRRGPAEDGRSASLLRADCAGRRLGYTGGDLPVGPHTSMQVSPGVVTFLFTDIEGSTRLWEQEPERMRPTLARHDAIVRAAVARNRGTVVKMTGDGVHAAFDDPLDAVNATLQLQHALTHPGTPDA